MKLNEIMFRLLILFCFLQTIVSIQKCSQLENANQNRAWQIMKLYKFDRIFILSVGSLSIVLLLSALYSWYLYRSFSTPSDILFAIVLGQLIKNTSLLGQAGYFTSKSHDVQMPDDFETSCFWMGLMSIIGNVTSIYYNLIFCVLLSYSIRNTLKGSFFNRFRYHLLSLAITGGIILTLILTSSLGRGLNGICGFRVASKQSTARFVLTTFVALICFYSMLKFRTKMPQNEYFKKQAVFGYYYYYMGIFATIQMIESLSFLISDIMCRTNSAQLVPALHVFYSISSCTSFFLSYAVVFLRWSHPILVKKILNFLYKDKIDQGEKLALELQQEETISLNEEQSSWLGCLLESLKGSQILSFIQGITISFFEKKKKYQNGVLNSLSFQRHYKFQINQEIIENFIEKQISSRESLIVKQKLGGLNTLPYEVTSYCPEAFSYLTPLPKIKQIIYSMDIRKNINIVKKESYLNGGKSGEFFFCTYDNKFICKTIKEDEALTYIAQIQNFLEYFRKEQKTLIVKILGLYRFKRKDIREEPIYLILMNNITLSPRQNNVRVYDIKGSEFNRSTLDEQNLEKNQNVRQQEKLRKYTLKDKDFQQLQQKVRVKQQKSKLLKRMLRKDIEFLGSSGFMDYSLLIIKRTGKETQSRGLSEIISSQQEGMIYNFGIIDYLQSWTLKRKAERVFKTLITKKQVTANSPINYSSRLSNFIDTII